jgi:hypothetical protein
MHVDEDESEDESEDEVCNAYECHKDIKFMNSLAGRILLARPTRAPPSTSKAC